jgi:hypothetical protein
LVWSLCLESLFCCKISYYWSINQSIVRRQSFKNKIKKVLCITKANCTDMKEQSKCGRNEIISASFLLKFKKEKS